MKGLVAIIMGVILCVVPARVVAEMPATTVTPENAERLDVKFTVTIQAMQAKADILRLSLNVVNKSPTHGQTGDPVLHLYEGDKRLGRVALRREKTDGEGTTFSCELATKLLAASTIGVPCYPTTPDKNLELCVQSMEYVLNIKGFMKNQ
jgi:hypothetical protein